MILPRMNATSRLLLPLLLLAGAVPAAEVGTSVTQGALSTTRINFFMTNNDPGAIYNSAELRLEAALGAVFSAIRSRNPAVAAMTTAGLISSGHLTGSIQPGEVSSGWTQNISPSTSIVAFGHGPFYTTWQNTASNAAQDTLTFTLNVGKNSATDPRLKNLLDFNGNSLVEAGERLLTLPALAAAPAEPDAGFVAQYGGVSPVTAAVARFAVAGDWLERGAAAAALGVQRSGADAVLSWQAQHGLSYELQTSLTLPSNPADWTPLSTQQRPNTPGPELAPQTHTHSGAFPAPARFYRLRITAP